MFTAEGAQWYAMGKGLSAFKVYRESLDAYEQLLDVCGAQWSLSEELSRSEADSRLRLAELNQPICTVLQIALVDLLRHWDVTPAAVVGHSSGEIAAAYCAGIISKKAAIEVAYLRGKFAKTVAEANLKGAMLAVSAGASAIQPQIEKLCSGRAVVACMNSPSSCTVSGDSSAIDELCESLQKSQINFQKLKVEVAYHSPHMHTIKDAYGRALSGIDKNTASKTIPMFSSVTGSIIDPENVGPQYWVNNLVSLVNFD